MAKILIAGGSGMIGQRLSEILEEKGHEPMHLSRGPGSGSRYLTFTWDPAQQQIEEKAILEADYVVNLAGAGIADSRWTASRKKLIIDSRVDGNRLLRQSFEKLQKWPKAYLSSAAIGYYGDRGEEWLSETAKPGTGFLSESCKAWEQAIQTIANAEVRTVAFRIGIVLSEKGGALQKMLLPLKFGLSSYFGNGKQWYSWIHIDDVCRMFIEGIENEGLNGTYNAVAPNPVRNKALADTLVDLVPHAAVALPAPEFALRLAMGEMADVVLTSSRVRSEKIQEAGFKFEFPELEDALKDLMNIE